MDKQFHPTHYNGCNQLSMLRLKLIHVSKEVKEVPVRHEAIIWAKADTLSIGPLDQNTKLFSSRNGIWKCCRQNCLTRVDWCLAARLLAVQLSKLHTGLCWCFQHDFEIYMLIAIGISQLWRSTRHSCLLHRIPIVDRTTPFQQARMRLNVKASPEYI